MVFHRTSDGGANMASIFGDGPSAMHMYWTGQQGRSLKVRGGKGGCQTGSGCGAKFQGFTTKDTKVHEGNQKHEPLSTHSPPGFSFVDLRALCGSRAPLGNDTVFCVRRSFRHNGRRSAHVTDSAVDIQGRHLKLSNLEKVLYPAAGFTKKDVIDYYARIAPAIIPHLAGRALTRKRYPDGVDGEPFFEKNAPMHKPDWVKTAPIWSGRNRRTVNYVLADDLPRWCGWPISRRWNCIRRWRWPRILLVRRRWCSILIPGRRRILCNAARWGCGCARFSSTSDCRVFRRLPGRRDCRFMFR